MLVTRNGQISSVLWRGEEYEANMYIVKEMDHLILSMDSCQDMGIIGEDFWESWSQGGTQCISGRGPPSGGGGNKQRVEDDCGAAHEEV